MKTVSFNNGFWYISCWRNQMLQQLEATCFFFCFVFVLHALNYAIHEVIDKCVCDAYLNCTLKWMQLKVTINALQFHSVLIDHISYLRSSSPCNVILLSAHHHRIATWWVVFSVHNFFTCIYTYLCFYIFCNALWIN